ncbi:ATP-dependent helicase HrpB [Sulfidibacter corallicola]|uniref:ATP-dependent helicase HrpB n=1 Tax=Sulfidibacter corallicola TaxID=2818388 RepID=A0A8A4TX62_SULCO|nr:ATP-dependent helicase HrpB [Sulfidibacter corallicola]QTD54070.1 ATP-dependent helicase HrpB [Sulfidibacter corallicola]
MSFPEHLPVDRVLPQLAKALREGSAAVLQAPTGSGKTTRVPPFLLKSGVLGDGLLMMLQPRRVAARACARTLAAQVGDRLGDTVGYQIRFERKASAKTRILVVTEGILTRRLLQDALLEGVNAVILDEFHERSVHTDLSLAFLRELSAVRDDLKLVVMSATLQTEPVSRFLSNCPIITAEGRTYPLTIHHHPTTTPRDFGPACEGALNALFADPEDDGGHVLIFLPGAPEINRVKRHLDQKSWPAKLVPLHGSLSSSEQDAALRPSRERRIILSTNIAETSLTIEGVSAVIDSGYQKQMFHHVGTGIDHLDLVRISRASAKQRAGRAGRQRPGRVIRLWDDALHQMLSENDEPEMSRIDLASTLLQVIDFHGPDLDDFPFFERPPEAVLNRASNTLRLLGALGDDGRQTDKGRRLAGLPLHPRLGAILLEGIARNRLGEAASLCALLGERPLRESAELSEQMELYADWREGKARLDPGTERACRRLRDIERQLLRQAASLTHGKTAPPGNPRSMGSEEWAALLLAGFPDRICRVVGQGLGRMVGGRGIAFTPPKHGSSFDLFIAVRLSERGTDRTAGKADQIVPITLATARTLLPTETRESAVFDAQRQAVRGVRQTVLGGLVLDEKQGVAVDAEAMSTALAEAAAQHFERVFQPDPKARRLLTRLRFAARHLPEEGWPDYTDSGLRAMLPTLCFGKKNFEALRKMDWQVHLLAPLSWQQRQLLDREVPERWQVPSGSSVIIDYEPAQDPAGTPVLAARIQEMFGMAETPRIARGRVALLCHLLGPNRRPVQITSDLKSFWDGGYAEVRKELRSRYPKHYWPENPYEAQAIRGVRPRK